MVYEIDRKEAFKMLSKDVTEDQKQLTEDLADMDFMTKRSWLAGEIQYYTTLNVRVKKPQLAFYAGGMNFQPFHRLVPFRYEITLDAKVKEAFAKHLAKNFPGAASSRGNRRNRN